MSAAALDETKSIAFIARIEDEAGPRSNVFRFDGSYKDKLKRLDDKEGDRRLGNALTVGSLEKTKSGEYEVTHHTISRFEIADSLRSGTLSMLPKHSPWSEVVHPVEVARVLESFLVHEVPANAATDVSCPAICATHNGNRPPNASATGPISAAVPVNPCNNKIPRGASPGISCATGTATWILRLIAAGDHAQASEEASPTPWP